MHSYGSTPAYKDRINQSVRQKYKTAFDDVYVPDGYEHRLVTYILDTSDIDDGRAQFNRVLGSPDAKQNSRERQIIANPITRFTSFVGLPNHCPEGQRQTWANIGNNLIGWQFDVTTARKNFNIIKAPFVFVWNLLLMAPSFARNMIRLVTEYLPLVGLKYCQSTILACKRRSKNLYGISMADATGNAVLYGLATLGGLVFGSLHFVGQAVTSPINAVRTAWKLGDDIVFKVRDPSTKKILGKVMGVVFAALSIAVTVTLYTLLFPLAIHAIGGLIAGKSVPVIGQVVSAVTNSAPAWLSTVGNSVVMPVLGNVFSAIGAAVSPAAAGVGFLAGAALTTVGLGVNRLVNVAKKAWHGSGRASVAPASEVNQEDVHGLGGSGSSVKQIHAGLRVRTPAASVPQAVPASAQNLQSVGTHNAGSRGSSVKQKSTPITRSAPIPIAKSAPEEQLGRRFGYSRSSDEE